MYSPYIIIVLLFGCFMFTKVKESSALSSEKFGPVVMKVLDMKFLKGPKKLNCSNNYLETNLNNVTYKLDIMKNVQFYKIKIAFWEQKNGVYSGTPDIVKVINKPCNHFFIDPLLKKYFRATNNCIVSKGLYEINLDMNKIFYEMIGKQFFYGSFRTQSTTVDPNCNIMCTVTEFILEKLKAG